MKNFLLLIIRTIFTILSCLLFVLFVAPMAGGVINIGNISGALLCVWIFCISIAPIHHKIKNIFCRRKFTKFLYRTVNLCFILFSIYGLIITSAMVYCAAQQPEKNSTAVVLGAQVKPWGPSVILQGRINAAEKYLEANPASCAVLSGGQGSDEPMSEAQAMYESLSDSGIDTSRLFIEDKSTNTTENMANSIKIIEENNLNNNLAVSTDGFHQLRVRIIARQLGIKGNVGAVNSDTSLFYLPTFIVREWFALPYQVIFR